MLLFLWQYPYMPPAVIAVFFGGNALLSREKFGFLPNLNAWSAQVKFPQCLTSMDDPHIQNKHSFLMVLTDGLPPPLPKR
jgi:hypothetical protein